MIFDKEGKTYIIDLNPKFPIILYDRSNFSIFNNLRFSNVVFIYIIPSSPKLFYSISNYNSWILVNVFFRRVVSTFRVGTTKSSILSKTLGHRFLFILVCSTIQIRCRTVMSGLPRKNTASGWKIIVFWSELTEIRCESRKNKYFSAVKIQKS